MMDGFRYSHRNGEFGLISIQAIKHLIAIVFLNLDSGECPYQGMKNMLYPDG